MLNHSDGDNHKHLQPKPVHRRTPGHDNSEHDPLANDLYYWGVLDHKEAERILAGLDVGSFLIRRSAINSSHYALSLRVNEHRQGVVVKHFKLYHESGEFFLNKQLKHFGSCLELVRDGLWSYHIEQIHNQQRAPAAVVHRQQFRLEHVFKGHTFRGLYWCEVCGQFLWILGMKCENCALVAHKKCSELEAVKLQECVRDRMATGDLEKRPCFGVKLDRILNHDRETTAPFVVVHCVQEVEARGLHQEGIYRVSAFADEIEGLRTAFERHGRSTVISSESLNIHSVAGVLKLFFRLLPTPLIPGSLLASIDEMPQLNSLKVSLLRLPAENWSCLKFMATHLRLVSSYEQDNKMNAENLATVFAPTLIGSKETDSSNPFTDLAREILFLTLIIKNSNILFSMSSA